MSEGEKARLLPKCNHGFHVECIDMWFQSHSTCPLCRDSVISTSSSTDNGNSNNVEVQGDDGSYSSDSNSDSDDGSDYASPMGIDAPVLPTNVLFWGNETRVSTFGQAAAAAAASASSSASSSGVSRVRGDDMVIDIPSRDQFCEECSSSPPQRVEEAKTPVMSRLRSLRRLLSMGMRVAPGQQV
ncbi:hypothetical protein SOVF_197360 [Spinacia oleracea]|nr:hypothetical protein SOVF_197360 [Spinacia oleracea]